MINCVMVNPIPQFWLLLTKLGSFSVAFMLEVGEGGMRGAAVDPNTNVYSNHPE